MSEAQEQEPSQRGRTSVPKVKETFDFAGSKYILKCYILFALFTNKNDGIEDMQTSVFLFISSQHASAQMGHHVILEQIHKW
jgi:hypothetical protein